MSRLLEGQFVIIYHLRIVWCNPAQLPVKVVAIVTIYTEAYTQ